MPSKRSTSRTSFAGSFSIYVSAKGSAVDFGSWVVFKCRLATTTAAAMLTLSVSFQQFCVGTILCSIKIENIFHFSKKRRHVAHGSLRLGSDPASGWLASCSSCHLDGGAWPHRHRGWRMAWQYCSCREALYCRIPRLGACVTVGTASHGATDSDFTVGAGTGPPRPRRAGGGILMIFLWQLMANYHDGEFQVDRPSDFGDSMI